MKDNSNAFYTSFLIWNVKRSLYFSAHFCEHSWEICIKEEFHLPCSFFFVDINAISIPSRSIYFTAHWQQFPHECLARLIEQSKHCFVNTGSVRAIQAFSWTGGTPIATNYSLVEVSVLQAFSTGLPTSVGQNLTIAVQGIVNPSSSGLLGCQQPLGNFSLLVGKWRVDSSLNDRFLCPIQEKPSNSEHFFLLEPVRAVSFDLTIA